MSELKHWPHHEYDYRLPVRYRLTGRGPGLVICLHGFQDHALSMLKRIGWLDDAALPFRVLAVNAPFPVPIFAGGEYIEAYSWYFRDTTSGFEVVSPAQAAAGLGRLITDLGLAAVPTVLFGFSQGAYLAPYLIKHLADPRAIIGLGGGFPTVNYDGLTHVKVFGVHGDLDERVAITGARAEHAALLARGFTGEFHAVEGLRHRITPAVEPLVRRLAAAALV